MLTKTGRDLPLLDMTKDDYVVPQGEENLYHVRIEIEEFDRKTGTRMSVPRIQKFGRSMWETTVRRELQRQGYTMLVLHDPAEPVVPATQSTETPEPPKKGRGGKKNDGVQD